MSTMKAHRWLMASLAISVAAVAFVSCKGSTSTTTSSSGTGGGGGAGGSGGSTSTGTTTVVDAGPLTCAESYTNIPKGTCDMLSQNCAPGKTCQPTLSGGKLTTTCQLAMGLKTAGETCYEADECAEHFICIGNPGKCAAVCCPPSDEPCNGGLCNVRVGFGGSEFVMTCTYGQPCTPLAADACPIGQDCHVQDFKDGISLCTEPSENPALELEPCQYLNDCASMQACYGGTGSKPGVCLYYCDTTGALAGNPPGLGGCPMGEKCSTKYNGAAINFGVKDLGLCIPVGGIPDAGAPDAGKDGGGSTTTSSSAGTGGAGTGGAGTGGAP